MTVKCEMCRNQTDSAFTKLVFEGVFCDTCAISLLPCFNKGDKQDTVKSKYSKEREEKTLWCVRVMCDECDDMPMNPPYSLDCFPSKYMYECSKCGNEKSLGFYSLWNKHHGGKQ